MTAEQYLFLLTNYASYACNAAAPQSTIEKRLSKGTALCAEGPVTWPMSKWTSASGPCTGPETGNDILLAMPFFKRAVQIASASKATVLNAVH